MIPSSWNRPAVAAFVRLLPGVHRAMQRHPSLAYGVEATRLALEHEALLVLEVVLLQR
jgi:hypothetical protein